MFAILNIRKLWYAGSRFFPFLQGVYWILTFFQDEAKLRPREKGLNDPHLGSIDRSFKCATVGLLLPLTIILLLMFSSVMRACLCVQVISVTLNLRNRYITLVCI